VIRWTVLHQRVGEWQWFVLGLRSPFRRSCRVRRRGAARWASSKRPPGQAVHRRSDARLLPGATSRSTCCFRVNRHREGVHIDDAGVIPPRVPGADANRWGPRDVAAAFPWLAPTGAHHVRASAMRRCGERKGGTAPRWAVAALETRKSSQIPRWTVLSRGMMVRLVVTPRLWRLRCLGRVLAHGAIRRAARTATPTLGAAPGRRVLPHTPGAVAADVVPARRRPTAPQRETARGR
jgi:hypothetical protein